jgi:hypothetical protein
MHMLTALLECSSSLQRLEDTTNSIDVGVQEIKTFLKRTDTRKLSPPLALAPDAVDSSARVDFSEKCMKAAEISQRWTAIGIEEWIKAGRWWLLRVRIQPKRLQGPEKFHSQLLVVQAHWELREIKDTLPHQAYVNLIKASWILVDIIAVHPQLSYIETSVRFDVMRLTEVRKNKSTLHLSV